MIFLTAMLELNLIDGISDLIDSIYECRTYFTNLFLKFIMNKNKPSIE